MENKKDKWGRKRKFIPKIVECGYRECTRGENGTKKKFLQKTYNHFFCAGDHRIAENSLLSGGLRDKRNKKGRKTCSKPGCKNKVPPENVFLCKECQRNAETSFFEDEHCCHQTYY